MILVVGATGVLGQKTARLLLADGHQVRAMTRVAERASDLAQQGAEVIVGDLVDPDSLARACRGVDRVFAAAHSFLGKGQYRSEAVDDRGHRALIDAARSQGVKRFVYTSALGASPNHPIDFHRTKYAIEQYLQASGLEHVILRPSAFMEWHAHIFNGKSILEKGRTQLLGSWHEAAQLRCGERCCAVGRDGADGARHSASHHRYRRAGKFQQQRSRRALCQNGRHRTAHQSSAARVGWSVSTNRTTDSPGHQPSDAHFEFA